MKYLLQPLLDIRARRRDAAEEALRAGRRRVAEAEQDLARRRRELEEYTAWRLRREDELWKQLLLRPVLRRELDEHYAEIHLLRAREATHLERILDAEKTLRDAKDALATAETAFRAAWRNVSKLEEHRELWRAEQNLLAEQGVERELEDFSNRRQEAHEADAANDYQEADHDLV